MLKKIAFVAGIMSILCGSLSPAAEQTKVQATEATLDQALLAGQLHINLRYRYEYVNEDDFNQDAHASTLRLRLNYATGKWYDWSGFAEFDYVGQVFLHSFNSGGGTSSADRNQYPVVADPKGADLNQLYLDYAGYTNTRLRFGRQRILLDDERFVGGVGWRQNEQTFDGASALFKGLPKTELFYSYVAQANRIFGERSAAGRHDVNAHLLNARIKASDNWQLTPYFYYIDNDDVAAFSTATLGARANGTFTLAGGTLKLLGEFATQSDAADNPVSYDTEYLHLSADWALKNGLSVGIGFESLGGDQNDPGKAFRTPLATLHKFQGWANQFLATPNAGVDDFSLNAKYKYQKWNFQAIYHDFSATEGSADWGSELDLAASRPLGKRYSILLKAAFFSADDAPFEDTTKLWIQLVANY